MKKGDAKRRVRDEGDLALGGNLSGGGAGKGRRRTAGGLEDEFGDVLKSVERGGGRASRGGDGYDELRNRGKKGTVLERSRTDSARKRDHEDDGGQEEGGRGTRKRSRFEIDAKNAKKKQNRSRSRN